jgi:hypothetical protein
MGAGDQVEVNDGGNVNVAVKRVKVRVKVDVDVKRRARWLRAARGSMRWR